MSSKLTEGDIRLLRQGAAHMHGVISPMAGRFNNGERRIEKLVRIGLATPNPHGDWYITDAGRAAIDTLHDI